MRTGLLAFEDACLIKSYLRGCTFRSQNHTADWHQVGFFEILVFTGSEY